MKVNNPKKQPRHLVHSSGSGVAFDCIILLFFLLVFVWLKILIAKYFPESFSYSFEFLIVFNVLKINIFII